MDGFFTKSTPGDPSSDVIILAGNIFFDGAVVHVARSRY
jgi:hypothetical protein